MGITAIFGGTFNPPHIGHQAMLKGLENNPDIDEIFVMPDRVPPHKVCDFLAKDQDRIEMCKQMIKGAQKAKLCLIEFQREGKSYSYHTVLALKEKYPEKKFAFVCGGDMLMSFDTWYKYEELIKLVPFIVFRRSNIDNQEFDKKVEMLTQKGMNIILEKEKIPQVSSSFIRNEKQIKDLVPAEVYDYIKSRGLYKVAGKNY